ncbi:YD repeat-containing protein [Pseudomonas putida S11]|nr:YD repeat-containing protein [Pseudomonas putida S11]
MRFAQISNWVARLLEETDPLGRKTTYEYHHLTTLVTQVSYPDGSTWRARYDDKGNLLAEIDALGQILNSEGRASALPVGLPHGRSVLQVEIYTLGYIRAVIVIAKVIGAF